MYAYIKVLSDHFRLLDYKCKYIHKCDLATSEIVKVSRTTSKEQIFIFRVQCPFRSFYLGVEREPD